MSLHLEWNNEQDAYPISEEFAVKLKLLLKLAGEAEQITDGEVALSFVDDKEIHRLNKEYRGIDRPTDVLSFSMQEVGEDELEIIYDEDDFEHEKLSDAERLDEETEDDDGDEDDDDAMFEEPLGDIIISVPRAISQSEEYGHSIERELGFLFVHGFLHLIGYDHQDEETEKAMFAKQEHILQQAGLLR
jgi:probable rRNA maturation factor